MRITRVTGSMDGAFYAPGDMIDEAFSPDAEIRQDSSEPILFMEEEGEKQLFAQEEWSLTKKDVIRYSIEGKARVVVKKTVDGERTFVENAKDVCIGSAYEGKVVFSIGEKEQILGLGQHEDGISNYRNVTQELYQNNMQIPMPVFLSTAGYAVLFDADCVMVYEEKENRITITLDAVEQIAYYVITGENLRELIRGIRRITGKAELLPKWAYGYVQSKERYRTQQEILDTAAEFQKRGIPLSCLVQDWLSWEEGKWGDKHLDKTRYPDLKAAVDELHKAGIAFMLSVWPNMNKGGADNQEMMEAEKLYANLSTYDAFDEEARALYWKQCERELFRAGTDAWWCDSTEPFTPDWNGSVKKTARERYEISKDALTKYMDARKANAFALYHARGIYENQRKADPSRRVVNLTRSGYPSIQKYGTILWSGDIMATWEVLKHQITEGLQMAASGIPYWTLDIGAFFAGNQKAWMKWSGAKEGTQPWFWNGDYEKGVEDKGYCELYVRWLQYGTFLPIMRSHGTDTPREPWNFGEPGTVYYDTIVKYIRLRYHLTPYIYSLAYQVYKMDAMLMRSLVFDYPEDERAAQVTDQFLFGDFLVCPVIAPVEFAAENRPVNGEPARSVYLPQGELWYDYETGEALEGGQVIRANAPVEKMPLYIRGGSILPVNGEGNVNLYEQQHEDIMDIEVYAGKDGSFTCYFDRGNGYEYLEGSYAAITMEWRDAEERLILSEVEGTYEHPHTFHVIIHTPDRRKIEKTVSYHGERCEPV